MEKETTLNPDVTQFLDELDHPFRAEIEQLREIILRTDSGLRENIKWNGPNYLFRDEDRITMRIHPPKQIQLIFHRGVQVKEQPAEKLIGDPAGLLTWKSNDRAVATFKNTAAIEKVESEIQALIAAWIHAAQ